MARISSRDRRSSHSSRRSKGSGGRKRARSISDDDESTRRVNRRKEVHKRYKKGDTSRRGRTDRRDEGSGSGRRGSKNDRRRRSRRDYSDESESYGSEDSRSDDDASSYDSRDRRGSSRKSGRGSKYQVNKRGPDEVPQDPVPASIAPIQTQPLPAVGAPQLPTPAQPQSAPMPTLEQAQSTPAQSKEEVLKDLEGGKGGEDDEQDDRSEDNEDEDTSTTKRSKVQAPADYGSAYKELYKQLCSRMVHRIMRFLFELYSKVQDKRRFQLKLVEIQQWNSSRVNQVASGFVRSNKDILRVFRFAYAANVLVMSSVVQRDEQSTDVEIDCPKFSDFVHRCFIETARNIFNHVEVLDPSLSGPVKIEVNEHLRASICNAIGTSLRMMVPIHKITPIKPEDEEQYAAMTEGNQEDGIDISDTEMPDDRDEEEVALTDGVPKRKKGKKRSDEPADLSDEGETEEDDFSGSEEEDYSGTSDEDDLSGSESGSEESEESESESESEEESESEPEERPSRRKRKVRFSDKNEGGEDDLAFF